MTMLVSIIMKGLDLFLIPFLAFRNGVIGERAKNAQKTLDKTKAANDARRNVDPNGMSNDKHNRD